jgi:hypothetical protein
MAKGKIDTIEKLAELMVSEFHDMRTEMNDRFEHVDQRSELSDERFERVEKRLEHLEVDNRDMKESLRHIEHDTGEMKDELRAISRAVDKDSMTILKHGKRLKRHEARIKSAARVR